MPATCCAWGCSNRNGPKAKENGVTFHMIPKSESHREQWIRAIRRQDANGNPWKPTANSTLCSEHFKQSDFKENSDLKRLLKDTAIPSIFKFPPHLKKKSPIKRQLPFKQRLEEEAKAAKR